MTQFGEGILPAFEVVRPRVAGIVVCDGKVLVQKPTNEADPCYAFIGGGYEVGDTFESRIRAEFEEETTAKVVSCRYLFVVENQFVMNKKFYHGLEMYLKVEIDRLNVESRESHLRQYWLPLVDLMSFNLRPHVVRDAIASGEYINIRHLRTS
ncbi:MAG TPA: NUDIX domain-containing protein [Planctomycetota bacterium]|nr:NUDIX domain-containing protein [Planctomycetota bacterium]